MSTNEPWLTSIVTKTPQEGFELAIKLSRMGVKSAQPDVAILKKLRPIYSENADNLLASSHIVAIHFQTIAMANNHWK